MISNYCCRLFVGSTSNKKTAPGDSNAVLQCFALSLDEFAFAVVCHVLDKLSNPAMEVFLTGNELAIYQFLVRDLYLFITGVNGWLFMG